MSTVEVGCENLCGNCEACEPLTWACRLVAAVPRSTPTSYRPSDPTLAESRRMAAVDSVLDPSALTDLLARALRGMGVATWLGDDSDLAMSFWFAYRTETNVGICLARIPFDGRVILGAVRKPRLRFGFTMPGARAVLSRLLALQLDCGADAALAVLGAT